MQLEIDEKVAKIRALEEKLALVQEAARRTANSTSGSDEPSAVSSSMLTEGNRMVDASDRAFFELLKRDAMQLRGRELIEHIRLQNGVGGQVQLYFINSFHLIL